MRIACLKVAVRMSHQEICAISQWCWLTTASSGMGRVKLVLCRAIQDVKHGSTIRRSQIHSGMEAESVESKCPGDEYRTQRWKQHWVLKHQGCRHVQNIRSAEHDIVHCWSQILHRPEANRCLRCSVHRQAFRGRGTGQRCCTCSDRELQG